MRLCRFTHQGTLQAGFYHEHSVVPLAAAARAYGDAQGRTFSLPGGSDLLDFLPPDGPGFAAARQLDAWLEANLGSLPAAARLATRDVQLHVPIPRPNKLFLLAGNYAAHIEEGGGRASERQETFPYVFMKPPSTTLTDPGQPVRIPQVSPNHIDWELELAVVIGRRSKGVKESDALGIVAGYTVIVDVSDRKFRPNPGRKPRDKDSFFDWQHGKWHDSFCPCGPCIASADAVADPQNLPMKLSVSGAVQQDATTALQIFPVAAVIEFISSFVTLEPGDMISTGTPSGVGSAKGIFLKPGDVMEASIGQIGTLVSPVVSGE
jgi:2-keto-4-pentenoate hydratase/2-oxohepta-3-ene-1,7-dioic acid hydratase in catechol pathway